MINVNEIIDAFRSAMLEHLGAVPDEINADGNPHRFSTNGKRDDKAGRYILHIDGGIPAGYFECHRQGIKHNWKAGQELAPSLSVEEREAIRQQAGEAKAKRQREHDRRYAATSRKAIQIWRNANQQPPTDFPYLLKKGIQPHGARFHGESLLIPMYDIDGKLWNLQRIFSDGQKRFMAWGRKRSMFSVLGAKLTGAESAFMVEGWATACTVADMEPGKPVIVAFDAGNLITVAGSVLGKFPHLNITLIADDDRKTEREKGINPGVSKALAVAAKYPSIAVVVPEFPADAPLELSDINDLMTYQHRGQYGH